MSRVGDGKRLLHDLTDEERRDVLQRARRAVYGEAGPELVAREWTGPRPLSYQQQQLWFLDRLAPGRSTYNVAAPFRVRGRLDRVALERALGAIVGRHESLRTTFSVVEGEPVQVVADEVPVELPSIDLRELPGDEREARALALVREEARRPFDLERGPLFRARLFALGEDEHAFIWSMHHIVSDGWSVAVLLHELDVLYTGFARGEEPALAPLRLQYADYVHWQRERLGDETSERLIEAWRERLEGLETLEFPTDRPRPQQATFDGALALRTLPPSLVERLRELSTEARGTLFPTLLAGYSVLISRYTSQTDLALGTVVANRTRSELEGLIGFFVNTLVLRVDVSGDPSFRELVTRAQEVVLDAQKNQELPFSKLVDELKPPRDPSRTPFFQLSFGLLNVGGAPAEVGGLRFEPRVTDVGESRFDLGVQAVELPEGMRLIAEYNTNLFEAGTIEALLAGFERLLVEAVTDPDARVSTLPVLSEEERERVLVEWNRTERPVRETTIVHEFAARVAEAPGALALVGGEVRLTYRELEQRANRLAHRLRKLGAGREAPVGICLTHTADLVVAMFGALASGAPYLALDPSFPRQRVLDLLADAGAAAAVTETGLVDRFEGWEGHVVDMGADAEDLLAEPDGPLEPLPLPRDLAYVMYTSGSTGRPKGVLIEHRSVINFIESTIDFFEIKPADRVLQFASLAFDVSVFEVFAALLAGASLFVAGEDDRRDVRRLAAFIREHELTVIDLPPSVLAQFGPEECPTERLAFVGGEPYSGEIVNRWNQGRRFVNGYGPTETTCVSIWHDCQGHLDRPPPIGRPLTNHHAYVLDKNLRPLPIGCPGELYVSGAGVARGYLGAPAMTAERFLPDPWAAERGARMYRTGDLARWRRDGTLEFLGRVDTQVKIRGIRIELGEIETLLAAHPGVLQAVAQPQDDASGQKQLVAYFTTEREPPPTAADLRAFLGAQLPPFMLPARFVRLDEIPRMTSGKVDRRALPAPDATRPELASEFVAPRGPTEETIARDVLAPLLGLDRVGAFDNFFELGGNSLQSVQVVSRLRDVFGVEIDLAHFFRAPTASDLARSVTEAQAKTLASDAELLAYLEEVEGLSAEAAEELLAAARDEGEEPSP